jgi:Holliday junction DNA helicase RuvA
VYYYIDGTVTVIEAGLAVIDCGGVGYLCQTSMNTLSHLETGKRAKLYTYVNVKEDAIDIFGFWDQSEKRCFTMLLGVSGVGPKAALSVLSAVTPEELALAVANEDERAITAAQGVGKRLAQRILLELRDKVAKESFVTGKNGLPAAGPQGLAGGKLADVTAALAVLGYSPAEITSALRQIDVESLTVEEIIRLVLKNSVK